MGCFVPHRPSPQTNEWYQMARPKISKVSLQGVQHFVVFCMIFLAGFFRIHHQRQRNFNV